MTRELAWITDAETGELEAAAVVLVDRARGIVGDLPAIRDDQELHIAGVRWTTPQPA